MPWYRILNPEDELKVLCEREKGIKTIPSAFQYLRRGVAQGFFGAFGEEDGHVGVILKNDRNRVVLWRNSDYCGVSDNIFKNALSAEDFSNALDSHRYVSWLERAVVDNVDERYRSRCDEALNKGVTDNKEKEEYAQLSWTEGVFEYKFSDIDAVVIDPTNIKSRIKGYAFSKVLEKKLGRKFDFVCRDESGKGVDDLERDGVKITVLGRKDEVKDFIKIYSSAMDATNNIIQPTAVSSLLDKENNIGRGDAR